MQLQNIISFSTLTAVAFAASSSVDPKDPNVSCFYTLIGLGDSSLTCINTASTDRETSTSVASVPANSTTTIASSSSATVAATTSLSSLPESIVPPTPLSSTPSVVAYSTAAKAIGLNSTSTPSLSSAHFTSTIVPSDESSIDDASATGFMTILPATNSTISSAIISSSAASPSSINNNSGSSSAPIETHSAAGNKLVASAVFGGFLSVLALL